MSMRNNRLYKYSIGFVPVYACRIGDTLVASCANGHPTLNEGMTKLTSSTKCYRYVRLLVTLSHPRQHFARVNTSPSLGTGNCTVEYRAWPLVLYIVCLIKFLSIFFTFLLYLFYVCVYGLCVNSRPTSPRLMLSI